MKEENNIKKERKNRKLERNLNERKEGKGERR